MNNSLKNPSNFAKEYARRKQLYKRYTLLVDKNSDLLMRLETWKILTGKPLNTLILEAIEEYLDKREND